MGNMEDYVGNIKKYVENMKKYVENMKKYVEHMERYLENMGIIYGNEKNFELSLSKQAISLYGGDGSWKNSEIPPRLWHLE